MYDYYNCLTVTFEVRNKIISEEHMLKLKKRKFESNGFLLESENLIKKQVKKSYFTRKSPERIDRSLYGHCRFFDGVYYFCWEVLDTDFVISIPYTAISKKDLKNLKKLAKHQKKELYIHFDCGPKGPGSVALTFILTNLAIGVLQEMGKDVYIYFKNRIIDKINIEKRDEFTEVIEIYADGDKDNPTYLDIKDESAEQLQKFETLIIENLLPQKKVISYNKNGAVYEKIPNQIDIEA